MTNLAIIGSGVTGSVTSYILKQSLPFVNVTILEKARGIGGRMCTSRSPGDDTCTVDLGAQYITKTNDLMEIQKKCYDQLLSAGILKQLSGSIDGMLHRHGQNVENYVCPKGSGSVVKYFIENSSPQMFFGQRVVGLTASVDKKEWITKIENFDEKKFDIVIFTIPVPQILQVDIKSAEPLGNLQIERLKMVKYNSRFALGLFYERNLCLVEENDFPFVARYVTENPVIRFVSFDDRKRGLKLDKTSVVIHSTKEFGEKYLEKDHKEIAPVMLAEVQKLFPNLPYPPATKSHKWRFSQVEEPYLDKPGCITLSQYPLLICGGDGFSSSNFEGCLYSAEKIVQAVIANLR